LNETGPYEFPQAAAGYYGQPFLVGVFNTGSRPTGELAVSVIGRFAADRERLDSIPVGGSTVFAVAPVLGLAEGEYYGAVIVGEGNANGLTTQGFTMHFTAVAPRYGISVSPESVELPTMAAKSADPPFLTVSVSNTGNLPTGALSVSLGDDGTGVSDADCFELSATRLDSIPEGASATFNVSPKSFLPAGSYTASVQVSGDSGISATIPVTLSVN
jgi:hypothetical protein